MALNMLWTSYATLTFIMYDQIRQKKPEMMQASHHSNFIVGTSDVILGYQGMSTDFWSEPPSPAQQNWVAGLVLVLKQQLCSTWKLQLRP